MNKELVDYIKQQLNINVSRNDITDVLLGQGWHQSEIDEAFLEADRVMIREEGSPLESGKFESDAEGGIGSSKKIIIAAIAVLALALVVILAMALAGGKKDNAPKPVNQNDQSQAQNQDQVKAQEQNPRTPAENQNSNQNQTEAQIDPATLAAIAELEKTITPPVGWTARRGTVATRPLAVYFKPAVERDASGKDVFNENISVVKDGLKAAGAADVAAYLAKSKTALQTKIADYKIVSEKKVNLSDGTAGLMISGSYTQSGVALKNIQMYAAKGDDIYIVTGAALAQNWDAEKDMIGGAVMSFGFPAK